LKLLAIDTATERCSVALAIDGVFIERGETTPRGHAELVLPMVEQVMRTGGLDYVDLDAFAFGRGPGAFTGVRIAAGVVQGLALGAARPVVPVSDLAALALAAAAVNERACVAFDARMGEIYWAVYERTAVDSVTVVQPERVSPPGEVQLAGPVASFAGSGFRAYPGLAGLAPGARLEPAALPSAREIAVLALAAWLRGEAVNARDVRPVYLRDDVVRTPPRPPV
jgi:tRNA threonylcarbamoyladenosine biosynthesis protein TsaB